MARKNRLALESLEVRSMMAADFFLELDGVRGESKIDAAEVGDAGTSPAASDYLATGDLDGVLIGMLLPAVQKVRDAAARMRCSGIEVGNIEFELDAGKGMEPLTVKLTDVMVSSIQDASDEKILIGLLLPAVRGAREAVVPETNDYKLKDVLISSLRGDSSAGDTVPTDSFSLNFAKIEFVMDLDLGFVDQEPSAYMTYTLEDCLISG